MMGDSRGKTTQQLHGAVRCGEAARRAGGLTSMLVACGASALLLGGCAVTHLSDSKALVRQSQAFEQAPAKPALRMLVVGDSTGVGTGADLPADSLAGRIAQGHPKLLVDNRARNGAKFADVLEQLRTASGRYDIVLVQAGGNDVIRLSNDEVLRRTIDDVAQRARELAPTVILMPCGNVGNSPFFYPPVNWLMTQRSRSLHRMVSDIAQRRDAVYVNLFREREDDPFTDSKTLNASDGLHPSTAGYAIWMQTLQDQAQIEQRLAAAR